MQSAENPRISYVGDAVEDDFTYSFKIFTASDLLVYVDDVLKTLNIHYTVSMNADGIGGTVTFVAAYIPAVAAVIDIVRSIALTQGMDLIEGDRLPAETLETAFDKATMILQDLDSKVSLLLAGGGVTPIPTNTILAMMGYQDVRRYSSINQAISTLGATVCTLYIPVAQTLAGNLTIPATMSLVIPRGGSIVKASTYTLTINGPLDAGPYQIFSGFSAGNVSFGAGAVEEIHPEWWGPNTVPGTTDMAVPLQSAWTAAELIYGKVSLLQTTYAYATKLVNDRPIQIIGVGAGSYENEGYYTPSTTLKWIGAAGGTMMDIGDGALPVAGVGLKNICFDANTLAATCLDIKEMRQSQLENILCWKYTGVGAKFSSFDAAGRNVQFNDFRNLHLCSTEVGSQGFVSYIYALSNLCWNNFYNLRVIYSGANAGVVLKGDNNRFYGTFIYRAAGAGYGIVIGDATGICKDNYFFHISAGSGGMHVTNSSIGNMVFGYDRSNAEPAPVVDAGSSLFGFVTGVANQIIGVQSFSAASTGGSNLRGSEVVAAGENHVHVTFAVAEPDDDYQIAITPYWSTTCYISSRLTTGFIINFGTVAPGGGSFAEWTLIRYS